MGIYAGVSGVRRKISQPYVGVNGARRIISKGFLGRSGTRYQFFGPLEDVVSLKIRIDYGYIYDVDSSGTVSNGVFSASLSELNRYASISISDNAFSVQCSITGKAVILSAQAIVVFADGHSVSIDNVSARYAQYGASISWPVRYYMYASASYGIVEGIHWNHCCATNLYPGHYEGSASGTVTLNTLNDYIINVGCGVKSGAGSVYAQMSFNTITIDGRNVPVRVVSNLN